MSLPGPRIGSTLDSRIRRCRTAEIAVTVTANGIPLADREVVVRQRTHAFLFGCHGGDALPSDAPAGAAVADLWLDLFNFATLTLYWDKFEPERGQTDPAQLLAGARHLAERGVVVKGHPLIWHSLAPAWLMDLSNADITTAVVERIQREMTALAGAIDMWDVINEPVIMPVYDRYDNGVTRVCREMGPVAMVRTVIDAARQANPRATLLINDFDISGAYERLIEGVLEAGIRIDALGVETHMHQGYFGDEKILDIVERLAPYGLPIHFTEITLVSGHLMPAHFVDLNDYQIPEWPSTPEGEQRQADDVVSLYTTLMSHPAVRAITYWGMRDSGWLGAPHGFVRADGSPKPAYHALRALVKGDWWLAPTTVTTDADGRIQVTGFLGDYEVSAAGATGAFRLDQPGPAAVQVELTG